MSSGVMNINIRSRCRWRRDSKWRERVGSMRRGSVDKDRESDVREGSRAAKSVTRALNWSSERFSAALYLIEVIVIGRTADRSMA